MQKYRFIVGTNILEIEDLENERINEAFKELYNYYNNNGTFLTFGWDSFWTYKDDFFEEVDSKNIPFTASSGEECKAAFHDGFFNNFTIAWQTELERGNYRNAIFIWDKALRFVKDWENRTGKHFHKGTPLYFQAVTCLENNEIERGFVLMYEGYLEDLEKNGGDDSFESPGKSFILFNPDDMTQFYRVKVDEIRHFVEDEFLADNNLTFEVFSNNFLRRDEVPILLKYQFYLNLFRIWKSRNLFATLSSSNEILGLLNIEIIFGFCRLIEPTFKALHPNQSTLSNKDLYRELVGSTPNIFDSIRVNQNWNNNTFLGEISNVFQSKKVMLSNIEHDLTDNEVAVLMTYGLRNLSAHDLYQSQFINTHYVGIINCVFNSFLKALS